MASRILRCIALCAFMAGFTYVVVIPTHEVTHCIFNWASGRVPGPCIVTFYPEGIGSGTVTGQTLEPGDFWWEHPVIYTSTILILISVLRAGIQWMLIAPSRIKTPSDRALASVVKRGT